MIFSIYESNRKELIDYYDGIPLMAVYTYNGQDFLLYAIEWDNTLDHLEYMLATMDEAEYRSLETAGFKQFLQKKLDQQALYHYTYGMCEDSPPPKIRLLTIEEAVEFFPTDEFKKGE